MSTITNSHVLAVQALMDEGHSQSEAITKHAKDTDTPRNTVYGAMRRAGLAGNATTTPKTPEDPITAARNLLEQALQNVDADVERLKTQADEATARYRAARDGAKDRKNDLKSKVAALTPQPEPVENPAPDADTPDADERTPDTSGAVS